ncbi:MAG: pirin family protein [Alphaproteobacteria bacterium]|nr:pirin family protein [Alphaproteobacteria bacterium]
MSEYMSRPIINIITAQRATEGAGFPIRRPFPTLQLDNLDPFLMLDEVGPKDWGPGEAVGAPDHPHRGFETISYILSGEKLHEDSKGDRQILGPGDVQWMTAGSGIVHSEMPSPAMREGGGRAHSFQIWLNLPRQYKMAAPRYQFVAGDETPIGGSADGLVSVKVIAGQAYGVQAVINTHTPVTLQDWTMRPGGRSDPLTPADQQMALYIFKGNLAVGSDGQSVDEGKLIIFGAGDSIELAVNNDAGEAARFLLFGGVPIGEPIARHGPFVMNTREELVQAFEDYQAGKLGEISR